MSILNMKAIIFEKISGAASYIKFEFFKSPPPTNEVAVSFWTVYSSLKDGGAG